MRHQELLVLRHGQRLDEVQDTWSASAERPWDPPLATHGLAQVLQESVLTALALQQASAAAALLQGRGVVQIVTSPFQRCLQTAAELARALRLSPSAIEVLHQNFLGRAVQGGATQWMWGEGGDVSLAWPAALAAWPEGAGGGGGAKGQAEPQVAATAVPCSPETIEAAHARYAAALEGIAERYSECACIAVVTHGECVRRAVTRVEPRALVYQVEHCGWVCARRDRHEDGTWGWWRLDAPGECCGVAWSV